jgi:hypothetical protein
MENQEEYGCHIQLMCIYFSLPRPIEMTQQLPQHQLVPHGHNTYTPLSTQPTHLIMENSATGRQSSIATERNANVLYSNSSPTTVEGSWLERKLRPKKVSARYPIKGKALLFATCGFGSLGDALFGYNSG